MSEQETLESRYDLLETYASLVKSERAASCSRSWIPVEGDKWSKAVCKDVWACPVCSGYILQHRKSEFESAVKYASDINIKCVTLLATVRSRERVALSEILEGLLASWTRTKNGKSWGIIKARYGIIGDVSALLIGFDLGLWSVTKQVVFFVDSNFELSKLTSLTQRITRRLSKFARENGVSGDQFITVRSSIGHDIDWECNRLSVDLLSRCDRGDSLAADLWTEYVESVKGKRCVVWSTGLSGMLNRTANRE